MAADKGSAIMWIIGISIYYFIIILLFTFISGITSNVDYSNNLNTIEELKQQAGSCGYPRTSASEFIYKETSCRTTNIETERECNETVGCEISSTFTSFITGNTYCDGDVNVTYYNDGEDIGRKLCEASQLDKDEELCGLMGCTWTDYSEMTDEEIGSLSQANPMHFLKAVKFLIGFNADFGLTGMQQLFISFILFYIPLILLIGSIYLLVPFI